MEKTCRTCKDSEDVSGITPRWVCKRNMGNLCGMKYKYWQPREEETMSNNHIEANSPPKREEKVEKLYTTGQMIDLMLENKKRRAWLVGERGRLGTAYWTDNHIMYGGGKFLICEDDNENQWTIIELEPQKVSFAEAFKAYRKNELTSIKSVVTGRIFGPKGEEILSLFEDETDEEIDGMWIILN